MDTIRFLHSTLAYVVLILLVVAVINAFLGLKNNRDFKSSDLRLSLFALIFTHIQFLIGLITYFMSPIGLEQLGEMKNASLRLTSLEHPLINLIAIALITIGWSKHKKTDLKKTKFKRIGFFYLIGLILILSRIPAHWYKF